MSQYMTYDKIRRILRGNDVVNAYNLVFEYLITVDKQTALQEPRYYKLYHELHFVFNSKHHEKYGILYEPHKSFLIAKRWYEIYEDHFSLFQYMFCYDEGIGVNKDPKKFEALKKLWFEEDKKYHAGWNSWRYFGKNYEELNTAATKEDLERDAHIVIEKMFFDIQKEFDFPVATFGGFFRPNRCFGKCNSSAKIITLSKNLFFQSEDFIRYIIIHEYCHLFYPHHRTSFWNKVKEYCPDYWKYEVQIYKGTL